MIRTISGATAALLIFFLSAAPALCQGQAVATVPDATAWVDRNEILIGDVISLTLQIDHEETVTIDPPSLQRGIGEFELTEQPQSLETAAPDGRTRKRIEYPISIYQLGEFEIPPLSVPYSIPDRATGTLETEPIPVNVVSTLESAEDGGSIRDIKEPLSVDGRSRILWVVLGMALLLAAIALAVWLWQRMKSKPKPVPAEPPIPAHVKALEALQALRNDPQLFNVERLEPFTVRCSEIVRTYLFDRYGIIAMDYTTEEIIASLRARQTPYELERRFREFFDECDLIKFARHAAGQAEMNALIDRAEALVNDTREDDAQRALNESAAPAQTTTDRPEVN